MCMYVCMCICMDANDWAYITYLAVLGGSVGWEIIVSDNAGTPSVSASPSGAISGNEPHSTDRNTLASDQARNERTDSPLTFKIILPAVSPACSAIESWYIHACDMTRLFVIHWLSKWYCPLKMKEVLYQYGRLFFGGSMLYTNYLYLYVCDMTHLCGFARVERFFRVAGSFFLYQMYVTCIVHPCRTYDVSDMNEACHTYGWVMSHIWMSHVTHINESCHTYEWVMSHPWMSRVAHNNESCHT